MSICLFQGHPRLVNAISKLYSKLLNRNIDANNEVLVTAGAYEALFATLQGHTSPGDEWIIIEPFFDCYVPMVESAGGVARFIPLKPVSKFFKTCMEMFMFMLNFMFMFMFSFKFIIMFMFRFIFMLNFKFIMMFMFIFVLKFMLILLFMFVFMLIFHVHVHRLSKSD